MATPSLFPQFMKATSGGGGGPTSVSVIIDGVEIMQTLEAEIVETILEAEIVETLLEAEIPEPLEAEID